MPGFSQNYRDSNGTWRTVTLTAEKLAKLRDEHRKHCTQIMEECQEDYPDDIELQLSIFDKRCDKVFTWIQQALDDKVRKSRE